MTDPEYRDSKHVDVARRSVSVVVPAYNEAAVIGMTLQRVTEYMVSLEDRWNWEVIIVDDGSTDGTGAIAEEFALSHSQVRVLHHAVNFNLGQALRYAFHSARGDYVVTLDADLSYSEDHIGLLLDAIVTQSARVALASPYAKGGRVTGVPFGRRIVSRAANRFLRMTAKGKIDTITGMARAYDRRFLNGLSLKAVDVEINAEIIYKAQVLRARIVQVPAHLDWTVQREVAGRRVSNLGASRSVAAYAFSGFLFRPFMFFVVPGLLLAAIAVYTLGWSAYHVLDAYADLSGGLDSRISAAFAAAWSASPHSFTVGGATLLLSVQLLSLGVLSAQQKRYFEEIFHLGTEVLRRSRPWEEALLAVAETESSSVETQAASPAPASHEPSTSNPGVTPSRP